MYIPITRRIRSIVDGSLVLCHGGCEFESRHRTVLFFCVCFFFIFFYFIFLLMFVFVALRPKSTAMVMAGQSVHLTTPG